jgi:hypothetical protein
MPRCGDPRSRGRWCLSLAPRTWMKQRRPTPATSEAASIHPSKRQRLPASLKAAPYSHTRVHGPPVIPSATCESGSWRLPPRLGSGPSVPTQPVFLTPPSAVGTAYMQHLECRDPTDDTKRSDTRTRAPLGVRLALLQPCSATAPPPAVLCWTSAPQPPAACTRYKQRPPPCSFNPVALWRTLLPVLSGKAGAHTHTQTRHLALRAPLSWSALPPPADCLATPA